MMKRMSEFQAMLLLGTRPGEIKKQMNLSHRQYYWLWDKVKEDFYEEFQEQREKVLVGSISRKLHLIQRLMEDLHDEKKKHSAAEKINQIDNDLLQILKTTGFIASVPEKLEVSSSSDSQVQSQLSEALRIVNERKKQFLPNPDADKAD